MNFNSTLPTLLKPLQKQIYQYKLRPRHSELVFSKIQFGLLLKVFKREKLSLAYTLQSLSNPEKQKTNLTVFTDQKFTLKKKKDRFGI